MTKEEAIAEARKGKKVTHSYFSPDEWLTYENDKVVLEDGVKCSPFEFWRWRTDASYDTDWEYFVEPIQPEEEKAEENFVIDDDVLAITLEHQKRYKELVKILGDQIGYGNMMDLASECWQDKLRAEGLPIDAAFVPAASWDIPLSIESRNHRIKHAVNSVINALRGVLNMEGPKEKIEEGIQFVRKEWDEYFTDMFDPVIPDSEFYSVQTKKNESRENHSEGI